ncbi:MAG: tRNA 2-thiouridine(34) synthase MnmA, partial [bacterium]
MKIIVGMSGGLDSSMAALLLKAAGHEVTGITLKVWPAECAKAREDVCCDERGIRSAADVARRIGVEHRIIDVESEFRKRVVTYFCNEYQRGRTPNPCAMCNSNIKFPVLLRYADEAGADAIATGHYARIVEQQGRFLLMRGVDRTKDQAYFLYGLTQSVLSRIVFPLGDLRKEDVRRMAEERDLSVQMRAESQEICFIPGNDYGAFLREACGEGILPGDILDKEGRVVGRHPGIEFFTIGQRGRLYLSSKVPRYVTSIDPKRRTITVGGLEDLARGEMKVSDMNWIAWDAPTGPFQTTVKIRYNHPGVMSEVTPQPDGTAIVRFDSPQNAVTPGQAAVFYDG